MESAIKDSCYRGLSDSLTAAIDTQNIDEVAAVLESADAYFNGGQLGLQQLADLYADALVAGYEF